MHHSSRPTQQLAELSFLPLKCGVRANKDSKLKGGKAPRAQIEETQRSDLQHWEALEPAEKARSHLDVPLEENVNCRVLEDSSVEARTIENAIAMLSVVEEAADRHPEWKPSHLPRLKLENPNMKLSQLKQLFKKEWMRSPDNPMNQQALPFNALK
ncbi:PREDICTED: coiled-coil domain-containing protein 124-like [Elephantulus edwardii]|uniref:coiled-coil domain-containing protein 124-like n=1 Tax=Elephantulus edwardii TaxID=28737 RepID=UPI0003F06610|nr:PREDICTED: coiled-coil domain-containing protein 124-like [Elephantulus edwardii]